MIFLPENLERTLFRMEQAFERCIVNGEEEYNLESMKVGFKLFTEFKANLEIGSSELLRCKDGEEVQAKIRLMKAVHEWFKYFNKDDVKMILNDVYVPDELRTRLARLTVEHGMEEAERMLCFVNHAHTSHLRNEDEDAEIKRFKLIRTQEQFDEMLLNLSATEIVKGFKDIRVAFVLENRREVYRRNELLDELHKLYKAHAGNYEVNFEDLTKMFEIWHDVRKTAVYYVYVPKVD